MAGTAQVWRVAAGQVLVMAAILPAAVAEDVEAPWLADLRPGAAAQAVPGTVMAWVDTCRCAA